MHLFRPMDIVLQKLRTDGSTKNADYGLYIMYIRLKRLTKKVERNRGF